MEPDNRFSTQQIQHRTETKANERIDDGTNGAAGTVLNPDSDIYKLERKTVHQRNDGTFGDTKHKE